MVDSILSISACCCSLIDEVIFISDFTLPTGMYLSQAVAKRIVKFLDKSSAFITVSSEAVRSTLLRITWKDVTCLVSSASSVFVIGRLAIAETAFIYLSLKSRYASRFILISLSFVFSALSCSSCNSALFVFPMLDIATPIKVRVDAKVADVIISGMYGISVVTIIP